MYRKQQLLNNIQWAHSVKNVLSFLCHICTNWHFFSIMQPQIKGTLFFSSSVFQKKGNG